MTSNNKPINVQQTSQNKKSRQARARYLKRKRRKRRIKICFLTISLLIITGIFLFAGFSVKTAKAINNDKVFIGLDDITDDSAQITKYYVYGTHFNIEGNINTENVSEINDIELILRNEYQDSDSVDTKEIILNSVLFEQEDESISFVTSDSINEGISLEDLSLGSYCLVIKVTYDDGEFEYKSLSENTEESDIEYYTLTKDNSNQKIKISFQNDTESDLSYLEILVSDTELPDDVYDVVIDAGHGGKDTGAINGQYTEAEFTLSYAKKLKSSLEALGLKVLLTRDGTEDSDTDMAYTMYDEDGRVNIAGASSAKYCISLHLNSSESYVSEGGVEVYCSTLCNTDFAQSLADNIVTYADAVYSGMETYKILDGVYARAYTQTELEEAEAKAYEQNYDPYFITTDTDYYFMIRELGGIATNAYMDGRNTDYGMNEYYDSNSGVECYLIELGYMCIDEELDNIVSNKSAYIKAITKSFQELLN